ncbi:MinD/ParA family protein [Alicyclobacillus sp. SO9]|uniref:MinD/ParA family protein n=1 Tax=Alicyclobacillus sp. SO9 TaxID=2665646 RepID=UPI0018E755A7|nr:MinD/ParA family protein [Alicyclobacillus sp. SO9]QQE80823.1 MinD/ParA family protein [Alicyclobacillus sp. SO9]
MDQAERLRSLVNQGPIQTAASKQIIAVASGKGGVGKTNFCVNFALELQKIHRSPVVLDVDLGFANVDVILGERPRHTIEDLLNGFSIWDVLQVSATGLPYLSGGAGLTELHTLSRAQVLHLKEEFSRLDDRYDTVLLDCSAGHSTNSEQLIAAATQLIVLTTPEPTSIADAYALLKMLSVNGQLPQVVTVVVNRASGIVEAKLAADKLKLVAAKFLGVNIDILGFILEDDAVPQAVMAQTALLLKYPHSKAASCIQQIARNYLHIDERSERRGFSKFLERLFGVYSHTQSEKFIS